MKPSDELLAELERGVERCKEAVDAYNKSDGNDRLWHRVQFASFSLSDTIKDAIDAGLLTHYRELRAKEEGK